MITDELETQLISLIEWRQRHHFGKYRGKVHKVRTDAELGLVDVKVPELFGDDFVVEKARPCSPFAGAGHGFVAIPEEGDGVWVEFEGGNPSSPIWSGFWWADNQMPEPKGALVRSFITTGGHKLVMDDDANEVQLLHAGGAELTMTDDDITIKIGDSSIKLTKTDITLLAGAVSPQPKIKIEASQIALETSTSGSVKLTSGGVDIGNGAMKVGA
ncbi:hypothetical protein HLB44_32555 [Aquincola sp. S2]|uniref:Gp5/Type VI secretion system Vgr protein OB-fold domain-containing protein n=1 Tax=Pseudaquabacterium terrae TaxID=2732868 RepID=A0ABX2ESK5_9BURK|nr:phage baseplate assembly protein V [Aquabacterium terrae]NRF71730.1 hypothetical protein [Aquabacterium terrae]